ncbi:ATP-binding protein [Streptacidiphilus sp. PAMC 29251]
MAPLRVGLDQRSSVGTARDRAARFLSCPPCPVPASATSFQDVLLVVSELVTNALRHAPGPATLSVVLAAGEVEVTVQDTSTRPPVARGGGLERGTGGFGWPTVQHLASRVQVLVHPDGKHVRAVLPW